MPHLVTTNVPDDVLLADKLKQQSDAELQRYQGTVQQHMDALSEQHLQRFKDEIMQRLQQQAQQQPASPNGFATATGAPEGQASVATPDTSTQDDDPLLGPSTVQSGPDVDSDFAPFAAAHGKSQTTTVAPASWEDFHQAVMQRLKDQGFDVSDSPAPASSTASSGAPPTSSGPQQDVGGLVPAQYNDQTLSSADANAACGPAAAVAFARANGRNPTLGEAVSLARQVGWTPQSGMAGAASEKALLDKMGVSSRLESTPDWGAIQQDASNGNPVAISTPQHYFVVDGYDPQSGAYHVGNSGTAVQVFGGSPWMTADQIAKAGRGISGVLYADHPMSPTPSVSALPPVATGEHQMGGELGAPAAPSDPGDDSAVQAALTTLDGGPSPSDQQTDPGTVQPLSAPAAGFQSDTADRETAVIPTAPAPSATPSSAPSYSLDDFHRAVMQRLKDQGFDVTPSPTQDAIPAPADTASASLAVTPPAAADGGTALTQPGGPLDLSRLAPIANPQIVDTTGAANPSAALDQGPAAVTTGSGGDEAATATPASANAASPAAPGPLTASGGPLDLSQLAPVVNPQVVDTTTPAAGSSPANGTQSSAGSAPSSGDQPTSPLDRLKGAIGDLVQEQIVNRLPNVTGYDPSKPIDQQNPAAAPAGTIASQASPDNPLTHPDLTAAAGINDFANELGDQAGTAIARGTGLDKVPGAEGALKIALNPENDVAMPAFGAADELGGLAATGARAAIGAAQGAAGAASQPDASAGSIAAGAALNAIGGAALEGLGKAVPALKGMVKDVAPDVVNAIGAAKESAGSALTDLASKASSLIGVDGERLGGAATVPDFLDSVSRAATDAAVAPMGGGAQRSMSDTADQLNGLIGTFAKTIPAATDPEAAASSLAASRSAVDLLAGSLADQFAKQKLTPAETQSVIDFAEGLGGQLTDKTAAVADTLKQTFDNAWTVANQAGVIEGKLANYFTHLVRPAAADVGELPADLSPKIIDDWVRFAMGRTRDAQGNIINPTVRDVEDFLASAHPGWQVIKDIPTVVQAHTAGLLKAAEDAQYTRWLTGWRDAKGMPGLSGEALPGYVKVNAPGLAKYVNQPAATALTEAGIASGSVPAVASSLPLYAHPDVAQGLKAYLARPLGDGMETPAVITGMGNAWRKANGIIVGLKLLNPLMHGWNLISETMKQHPLAAAAGAYAGSQAPADSPIERLEHTGEGLLAGALAGTAAPRLSLQGGAHLDAGGLVQAVRTLRDPAALAQVVKDSGLNLAAAREFSGRLSDALAPAQTPNLAQQVGKAVVAPLRGLQALNHKVLFDVMGQHLQLASYFDELARTGDPKVAGAYANNKFGQLTQQELGLLTRWIAQNAAFAGQWATSRARQWGAVVGAPGLGGSVGNVRQFGLSETQNAILANSLRRDVAAGTALMLGTHAMLNQQLSGKWPWQNDEGRWLDVNTGTTDEQGRAVYIADPFFRGEQDLLHFMAVPGTPAARVLGTNTVAAAVNKAAPLAGTAAALGTRSQYLQPSGQVPFVQGGPPIVAPGSDLKDGLLQSAAFLANQLQPAQVTARKPTTSPDGIKLKQPEPLTITGPGGSQYVEGQGFSGPPSAQEAAEGVANTLAGIRQAQGPRYQDKADYQQAQQDQRNQMYGPKVVDLFDRSGVQIQPPPNTVKVRGVDIPLTAADRRSFEQARAQALQGLVEKVSADDWTPSQLAALARRVEAQAYRSAEGKLVQSIDPKDNPDEIPRRQQVAGKR
jgi:hypothetical protein